MNVKLTQQFINSERFGFKHIRNPQGQICIFLTPPSATDGDSFSFQQIANNPSQAEITNSLGIVTTINYTDIVTCLENEICDLDEAIANQLINQGIMEAV